MYLIETWRFLFCPSGEGQSFQQQKLLGLWVIIGFLTFLVLEKIFLEKEEEYPGMVSQQPEGRECSCIWSSVLNTLSALSASLRKSFCSCEYLVIALGGFFATFLLLVCRSFIFKLLFCGFNWDFSLLVWFCSLCGKVKESSSFCGDGAGALCKWNFCSSKLWGVTACWSMFHWPIMTHSLSGSLVRTKASLLEDVSSWSCPWPDVCLGDFVR